MKKIKTITCHHVYNYGASLQTFATQSYLESLGHEVEVIDYRLPEHIAYEFFSVPSANKIYPYTQKFPLLKLLYCPYGNRHQYRTWGRKKKFDAFDAAHLHLTPTYRSIEELRRNPPQADVYLAGSDQIWNTDMSNGSDAGYYLDFGAPEVKRISYAASFGVSRIKPELVDFVASHLRRFDCISVREATGLTILEGMGISGEAVMDPVFLLERHEWISRLRLIPEKGDYIFLYDFHHDDDAIRQFTLALAAEKKLKIIAVNDQSQTPYADRQINNAGPREFLQWLAGARYVVCNSFHATAFSLIFQKEFATFPLVTQRNPSRMIDLLSGVGMLHHFAPESPGVFSLPTDWGQVGALMNEKIDYSKRFLNNAIETL